ncbi:Alpha/Beta hydrolase protein [Immersiella caudata]|uniref:Feruloyl esterase C n=1 Tax=Immersiella caudata TaxID=314043 RepID=A0AA39WFJ9_9PEZI|nr:Alpha/Beta hydrolase protein [Immersiella caudata]
MQAKLNFLAAAAVLLSIAVDGILGLPSPGCSKPATVASRNNTMTVNGKTRAYVVRLPQNYDTNKQYRLIFQFHWAHGSASQIINGGYATPYYGLPPLDKNKSAIYIIPEGLDEGGYQGWGNRNNQDVEFTDAMITTLQNGLCIDQNLIFAMGHSYGAGMSYALACARPNVFRAVAINSGGLISGCTGGTSPIAMYIQHSLRDSTLPIAGGEPFEIGRHLNIEYEGCAAGSPLTWVPYDGAPNDVGHVPAPKDAGAAASFTPENNWNFFSQFS